jgi:DNA invertase Pin-like site-specific DNA recombinase
VAAMLVGYARTSTVEQVAGLESQKRDLTTAGVEKVFAEQISSVDSTRPSLAAAIEFVRAGDTFVVTKLDRLARSVADLLNIVEKLTAKGVALRILAMNLDTATPTGRLLLNMLASVAQFEREIMLERQREGIAKARSKGLYKGRKPTARAKADEVHKLAGDGLTREEMAKALGIGVASVYRILANGKTTAKLGLSAHTA